MNPSLPKRVVDEAMERDPESARAEYMAEFRSDLERFINVRLASDEKPKHTSCNS